MFLNDLLVNPTRAQRREFVNAFKAFCFFLQDDPHLGNLFLYGNSLNDRLMSVLCDAMRYNEVIESVDLSKNK